MDIFSLVVKILQSYIKALIAGYELLFISVLCRRCKTLLQKSCEDSEAVWWGAQRFAQLFLHCHAPLLSAHIQKCAGCRMLEGFSPLNLTKCAPTHPSLDKQTWCTSWHGCTALQDKLLLNRAGLNVLNLFWPHSWSHGIKLQDWKQNYSVDVALNPKPLTTRDIFSDLVSLTWDPFFLAGGTGSVIALLSLCRASPQNLH